MLVSTGDGGGRISAEGACAKRFRFSLGSGRTTVTWRSAPLAQSSSHATIRAPRSHALTLLALTKHSVDVNDTATFNIDRPHIPIPRRKI